MTEASYFSHGGKHYITMGTFQLSEAGLLADPNAIFSEPSVIAPEVLGWLAAHGAAYGEGITGVPTFIFRSIDTMMCFIEHHDLTIKDDKL